VIVAPSPPKCAARTAMMIAAYATAVITVQRNIRLPTPHRKVMTNTTMKMPEKIAAKVAILSIARVALTSSVNGLSQPSVNQPLQFWGAVTPFDSGPRGPSGRILAHRSWRAWDMGPPQQAKEERVG
jgi:hypothetical protein